MSSERTLLAQFLTELLRLDSPGDNPWAVALYACLFCTGVDSENLARLHSMLPLNCQLDPQSYMRFHDYYLEEWGADGRRGIPLTDEQTRSAFAALAQGVCLTELYTALLMEVGLAQDKLGVLTWCTIACDPVENATMYNMQVETGREQMNARWQLRIRKADARMHLYVHADPAHLNMAGVQRLLALFNNTERPWQREPPSIYANDVLICFRLELPGDQDVLQQVNLNVEHGIMFATNADNNQLAFCQAIYALFRRLGLPVTRVGNYHMQ